MWPSGFVRGRLLLIGLAATALGYFLSGMWSDALFGLGILMSIVGAFQLRPSAAPEAPASPLEKIRLIGVQTRVLCNICGAVSDNDQVCSDCGARLD